ncbi:hypothetical protein N7520_007902 [Penicillium odoratum]|uniref:uncharacterized protein n=1 Tax=Penicillium odoratum TaxID=1167516 RepID=UPI002546BD3B|nr:uncharacterized protein N7520_007902 [Penicillium odoratum]KAJ5760746.1 hypothetical protein N7520_007902 [Penicillium odoratum]
MASTGVCHEFARLGRCSKSVCRFQHTRNAQSSIQDTQNRKNRPNQTSVLSESDGELQAWKNSFVLKSSFTSDHDGKLEKFFKKARQLIEMDAGSKQDVIRTLSQEHGLHVIRSLLEQSFELYDDDLVFNSQIMPFLEIITHPTVLGSMILQQFVGTIYGYVFGIEGARAARVLGKICNLLEKNTAKETSIQILEVSLLFFSRILDLNSTAIIQESLHQLAKRFEWVFNSMVKDHGPTQLAHCRDYLTRLRRRLAVGASLPTASAQNRSERNDDAFVFLRESPGGRHGNDHGDICDIAIMPTFEEIASGRSEYLPVNSSAEWHLEGIDGLLDRNFRLLREDTVGQLRDAVHHLLDDAQSIHPKMQLRKHEYKNAAIANCHANWLTGLEFEVRIPQPAILTGKTTIAREEWWVASRRLQPGALVCLSIHQLASILFCTVAEQKGPRVEPKEEKRKPGGNLWRRAATASITLVLVDPREANVKTVLDLYDRTGVALSLVEFPGILLPSFEPTLKALQTIKKNPVMPFLDLLMPSTPGMPSSIHLAPPLYSLKSEFAFNLASLMKDQADFLVYPNKKVDLQGLHGNSTLDEAQAEALVHCLQHNIGLIQGPPGTGKSYTGAALIKVLLESKKSVALGPIICVTFTNHALDQLLEDVLDQGITSKVIRIGGQSKSERLDAFNLNVIARNLERTKMEKGSSFQERQIMQKSEVKFNNINLRKQVPAADLVSFLRVYYPHHHKQLFGEGGSDFQPVVSGNSNSIIRKWVNSGLQLKHDPQSMEKLLGANLFDLSHQERWILHNLWTKEILEHAQKGAIEAITSHSVAKSRYTAIQDELHLRCLHQADVVGMTTAGLARRLKMLQNLQCKVVLCEEAGEVLEPHLLTAFLPEVEHVILIGDHQQLPPRVQNYDLSRENRNNGAQYSLDVSLFERLLDPKNTALGCELPFKALETQRRMHPSIAELIRGPSYPHLKDHSVVSQWPEVTGMRRRLFWFDHRVPEGGLSNAEDLSTSHWNDFEVDLTMALVNHLIRQGGYQEGNIAVITPYLGQLHRFRQKLQDSVILALNENDQEDLKNAGFEYDPQVNKSVMKAPLSQVLRVSTVDNFQGEEAKVVVVSLVRSNQNSSCGFLRTPNRINVLLSRAQHGMYIIGNSTTSRHVKMWAQVIDILRRNNNIGGALELQCPRHPDTIIKVTKPDDFARLSPEGGCDLPCASRLSCGHPCIQKCHSDVLHSAVKCLEPCPRSRKGCDHQCPNIAVQKSAKL